MLFKRFPGNLILPKLVVGCHERNFEVSEVGFCNVTKLRSAIIILLHLLYYCYYYTTATTILLLLLYCWFFLIPSTNPQLADIALRQTLTIGALHHRQYCCFMNRSTIPQPINYNTQAGSSCR